MDIICPEMRCFFVSILSYERFRVTYIQRYKYMSALLNLLGGDFIVGWGEGGCTSGPRCLSGPERIACLPQALNRICRDVFSRGFDKFCAAKSTNNLYWYSTN